MYQTGVHAMGMLCCFGCAKACCAGDMETAEASCRDTTLNLGRYVQVERSCSIDFCTAKQWHLGVPWEDAQEAGGI